jgi:alanine racemase
MNKVEINLNSINSNVNYFKSLLDSETKLIGVVKANAYGHGLEDVGRVVWTSGADILAVFSVDEAVMLRVARVRSPIIVLGPVEEKDFHRLLDFDITVTVSDFEIVYKLSKVSKAENKWAKIDVKIETGMNRYGFKSHEVVENVRKIMALGHVKIEGMHSHIADPADITVTKEQIKVLESVMFSFQQNNFDIPMVHLAATDTIVRHPDAHFGAVQLGIGIYGYGDFKGYQDVLKPALELKSHISAVKLVSKGETIGYGRTYEAKDVMKIAILPIGYFDGVLRSLSNKGDVLIAGKRAKIVGRICMNSMMVDVTGIKCAVGDEATLIGIQGNDKIWADEIAKKTGTIAHEILCRIPEHLPREYRFK